MIVFSSDILLKYDCLFYPCNAADSRVSQKDISEFRGAEALERLFYTEGREIYLKDYHPTDVQAEVMIRGNISPSYISFICINDEQLTNEYKINFPRFKFIYVPDSTRVFNTRKAFIFGH